MTTGERTRHIMTKAEANRLGHEARMMVSAIGDTWHAVPVAGPDKRPAACKRQPALGWKPEVNHRVTCQACIRRLRRVPGKGGPKW